MNTRDQCISKGDNKKIYSKNYDEAYADVEL
jgi:hypothetical protein